MIKVKLRDLRIIEVPKNITIYEVALKISPSVAKKALIGKVNDSYKNITSELSEDCNLDIITSDSLDGLNAIKNSTSFLLAHAVKNIYPDTKLAYPEYNNNGFFYDFDFSKNITHSDLSLIEKEMENIIKSNLKIETFKISKSKAIEIMSKRNELYKLNYIKESNLSEFTLYKQGDFVDVCDGLVVSFTSQLKIFKLLSIAGAYWKNNSNNKMLQRIYGVSFPKKSDLDNHIKMIEESKKRDHRKLGKELKLFTLMDEGPGFPFFLSNGLVLKQNLIDYWRKLHKDYGYIEIETPLILNKKLWETSGHWQHYKENMYTLNIDSEEYAIKPMSCPGGMLIYASEKHSYRDFPIRAAELGKVHRHELSGALNGLIRVRSFTQDDAHIFMLPDQITCEIINVIKLIDEIYTTFGFTYSVELSTKPENAIGSEEDWELAESSLENALKLSNLDYKINEGDGAFYGPKIDFHLKDSLGRSHQCGTIQLDFQLPQRFNLTYTGKDGKDHRPIVIHRAIFGSLERFIGILIEHFSGKFPIWLSPIQVKILPISDKYLEFANKIEKNLSSEHIRAEINNKNEKIGYKIREARNERVPYIIIVGEEELSENKISIRSRANGDEGLLSIEDFILRVKEEIEKKTII